ncbi:germination protein, Ger(x)C family [Paenibacillus tianmuensis]|uniref:Germination protein, Ger(X)C family n=1 Tax=Paenibacillus tianmuensis TaxID=624147 RepID=A0A1G4PGN5_9BACL|nr:Ger(x)C family spore germination protein [Paenibacillus tianmuensis]SCW31410.1 germination protein, Ger(x)C family [Paenibacillus tianmuensis]
MKRWVMLGLLVLLLVPGCSNDKINVEDLTLGLMLGMDLDQDNHMVYYLSSPVFNKEAKKKNEEFGRKTETFRQAMTGFDAMTTGLTIRGKVQVMLVGKRVLQHPDWFRLFDVVYRDAKYSVNARVVAVDGPVSEIIDFYPLDKPRLPLHMTKLIDTANRRGITVRTTQQELHRQMYEKGMTPSISEVKMGKAVEVTGTAVLNERGEYAELLGLQESSLLLLLQNRGKEINLSVEIPGKGHGRPVSRSVTTFRVKSVKMKIKTKHAQDKFQFDIDIRLPIALSERLFPFDVRKKGDKLEQAIDKQLKRQFEQMIRSFQKHQVDPIGLGLYARAHEYQAYKKVQEHWGEALAKADVKLSVKTEIVDMGPAK